MTGGDDNIIHDLRHYTEDWSDDLELLWQNKLLNESAFITFAKNRGTPVSGVIKGDPSEFNRRGWLPHDGIGADGALLFHPFRVYPLHRILEACRLKISSSSSLDRQALPGLVVRVARELMPTVDEIGISTVGWNRIVDLAVLLDPLYWPAVTGKQTRSAFVSNEEYEAQLQEYRQKAELLVGQLDPEEWRKLHEALRIDAARMDDNNELYLLLRLSKWSSRERLKGRISGALWIRHMAEVLRRAFENVHRVSWLEEDQAFGWWRPGGRTVAYGSDRPLDDVLESRPRLAFHFGLTTGSAVRWYVEGDTEYHAILSVIPDPAKAGVELVNLRGNLAIERDNIALKLRDGLIEDCALRRFSIISFDTDVAANVKAIRRQVEQGNVVGFIAAHRPDFEFANFTLDELVEIAANIDDAHGVSGTTVRDADWEGVACSSGFEQRYQDISARRPRKLKGAEWGSALAEYAGNYPDRPDTQSERPFWQEIRAALQARTAHYDLQRQNFHFDPDTFDLVRRCD